MPRRNWWIGTTVIALAILVHALVPRFEGRSCTGLPLLSLDRWTGGEAVKVEPPPLTPRDPGSVTTGSVGIAAAAGNAAAATAFNAADSHNDPAPVASWMGGTASACTIRHHVRTRAAAVAGERSRRGSGSLRIDNETGSDATAVLVADSDGAPRRAIFIRPGQVGLIAAVEAGRYHLRFQLGSGGLGERRFCQSAASDLDEPFDFTDAEPGAEPRVAEYTVTLHPVDAATARTHALSVLPLEPPPM
jgi:hypothetical protein